MILTGEGLAPAPGVSWCIELRNHPDATDPSLLQNGGHVITAVPVVFTVGALWSNSGYNIKNM